LKSDLYTLSKFIDFMKTRQQLNSQEEQFRIECAEKYCIEMQQNISLRALMLMK